MAKDNTPVEVAVSIQRKVNLGNYESLDVFFSLSHITAETPDEELVEALQAGDRAYEAVRAAIVNRLDEVKETR